MRILLATDAWRPQVNGVVRTLEMTIAELEHLGHVVELIEPNQFAHYPCPFYPEVELSNNLAENYMRGVALGRKNWIHIGSPLAGPRVAAILSVTESCRRLGIPLREYLVGILPGLADVRIQELADLTPAAWAARSR